MPNHTRLSELIKALEEASPDTTGLAAPIVRETTTGLLPQAASEALPLPAGDGTAPDRIWRPSGRPAFSSRWTLTADALMYRYGGVSAEDFGSVTVTLPNGREHVVRDMHYALGNGSVGMHLVPVSDDGTPESYQPIDAFLRQALYGDGAGPDAPIFALIAYVHPENHSGQLTDLATTMLKTEMGHTHMGAYLGRGMTSNAPEEYHGRRWEVETAESGKPRGYPANVQIVSLEGVDQEVLVRNARLCDQILNRGVQFPDDYKNDKYRLIDLNSVLMFYRDWLRSTSKVPARRKGTGYLKDNTWCTYCAEHKTAVVNVMLNLPHNEASFREVYGAEEGPALWKDFVDRHNELNPGDPWRDDEATAFTPLWKQDGLSPADIAPFDGAEQYEAYHDALATRTLEAYDGPQPLDPGRALAWVPETTADLVNDFLETYASFVDVGAPICASVLMGFRDELVDRLGISDEQFLQHAIPIVSKMMVAEALVEAPGKADWLDTARAQLYAAFGGNPADLAAGPDSNRLALVDTCLNPVKAALADIQAGSPATRAEAYVWLKERTREDLEKSRTIAAARAGLTVFYSPPAVSHRVSIGMHEGHPRVTIRTVCTAVERTHVADA
jgi:hypothetical protein